MDNSGTIITVAGNGTAGYSGDNGSATSAEFSSPYRVAVDTSGNLYIADTSNSCIRKVDAGGTITTVAGICTSAGYSGDDGPATSAQLYQPTGLALGSSGVLYIADMMNGRIRKVDASGIITTVAVTGIVWSVAVDSLGNLYLALVLSNSVAELDTSGAITTVAGNGTAGYSGDNGPATSAQLNRPNDVTIDSLGNLYIDEWYSNRVRKVY